jgi:apolipoprotein D and lipocalin family protein
MKPNLLSRLHVGGSFPFSRAASVSTLARRALLSLTAAGLMLGPLSSCVSKPETATVTAVRGFDAKRYEGRWYEIARLDHPVERNQTNVTATYSESPDGGMLILNRGYDTKSRKWKTADGHARMVGDAGTGSFKSKVYSPFYATYHVMALDQKNYSYALVASEDKDHLWILSRTPHMDERTLAELKNRARSLGYPTEDLIMVSHEAVPEEG